jgi:hypothetical protein
VTVLFLVRLKLMEEVRQVVPNIGLQAIQDIVISDSTRALYVIEIWSLLRWLRENEKSSHVVTEYCKGMFLFFEDTSPKLGSKRLFNKYKEMFEEFLRKPDVTPLIHEALFLQELRNGKSGLYLSKVAHGVKRSACFHLFRCQNGKGYLDAFSSKIGNLFKGFNRILAQRKKERIQANIREAALNGKPIDTIQADSKFFFKLKFF